MALIQLLRDQRLWDIVARGVENSMTFTDDLQRGELVTSCLGLFEQKRGLDSGFHILMEAACGTELRTFLQMDYYQLASIYL
jgi:hypothetical protein